MGFAEDEDLVEIPDNLVGKGVENIGSDEDRGCVSESEEETHYVAEDPGVSREKLLQGNIMSQIRRPTSKLSGKLVAQVLLVAREFHVIPERLQFLF